MTDCEEWRVAISEVVNECPECNQKPEMWEETFFGIPGTKFQVKCPRCGRKTAHHISTQKAAYEWNKGHAEKSRNRDKPIDNDCLVDLMGNVVHAAIEDYQRLQSKDYLTKADKKCMRDIEEFINENPYMLPYDRDYILDELWKENTRKKQVS